MNVAAAFSSCGPVRMTGSPAPSAPKSNSTFCSVIGGATFCCLTSGVGTAVGALTSSRFMAGSGARTGAGVDVGTGVGAGVGADPEDAKFYSEL